MATPQKGSTKKTPTRAHQGEHHHQECLFHLARACSARSRDYHDILGDRFPAYAYRRRRRQPDPIRDPRHRPGRPSRPTATLAALRPSWEFLFFHQVGSLDSMFAGLPNIKPIRVDIKGDRWRETINPWQQIRLPLALRGRRRDCCTAPAGPSPRYT